MLDFDLTATTVGQYMAAMRLSSNGTLKVATWNMAGDGSFTLVDEDAAGPASALAVRALSPLHAAVAVRTQEGFLKTILWELDLGNLTRRGDSTGLKNPDSIWNDVAIDRMRLTGLRSA